MGKSTVHPQGTQARPDREFSCCSRGRPETFNSGRAPNRLSRVPSLPLPFPLSPAAQLCPWRLREDARQTSLSETPHTVYLEERPVPWKAPSCPPLPPGVLGACNHLTHWPLQQTVFSNLFQELLPKHQKPLFSHLSYRFIIPDFLEMLLLEL